LEEYASRRQEAVASLSFAEEVDVEEEEENSKFDET